MYTLLAIYGKAQGHKKWKTAASVGQAEITVTLPRPGQAGARGLYPKRDAVAQTEQ